MKGGIYSAYSAFVRLCPPLSAFGQYFLFFEKDSRHVAQIEENGGSWTVPVEFKLDHVRRPGCCCESLRTVTREPRPGIRAMRSG
jgi:hypothetical protein